ncbi:MAG: VCBS repeat-containing protein [Calditerrivibrio sp.]|nr:VCBS repeat-containing protein [Calditerrivibrio sp.]
MRFIRFFIVISLLLSLSMSAEARFEGLIKSLDEYFSAENGIVIAVDGNMVTTDIGLEQGAFVGKIFKVFREGQEIKHPITGVVLGKKKTYLGTIRIKDVFDKYALAEVIDKTADIKVADQVISEKPVKVDTAFLNFNKRIEFLLTDELSKSKILIFDKQSPVKLNFYQQENGVIKTDVVVNDKIVKTILFSDVNVGDDRTKAFGATTDLVRSEMFSLDLKTVTVGKVFKDNNDYVIAADSKNVYIFKFDGNKFLKVAEIRGEFDDIQSVETIDLNKNGIDEIYISNIYENKEARSYIYELNNEGKFVKVGSHHPFLFRTIMINGDKKLVCQRVSRDGNYLGAVSYFEWVDGQFRRGEAIEGSEKVGIYGFGYADLDGDGKKEILWVDDDFKLRVYKGKDEIYRSVEFFNQTPLYFLMNQEVLLKEQKGYGPNDNPIELRQYRKYLKNRIFVNDKNELFLLRNTQTFKMLPMIEKFSDSSIGRYVWQAKMIRKSWESDMFEPVITDYYVVEKYGKYYAYAIRNTSPSPKGGLLKTLFNTAKSEIIYIEIK